MATPKRKKAAPAKYAAGTTVSIARSREEIERLLKNYGAKSFMYGVRGNEAAVMFEMNGRQYRIQVHYPSLTSFTSPQRTREQVQAAYEAEQRRRWRSLVLVIKAKLEAVKSEITTIEQEFLAHAVMPNKQTVSQWLEPQLAEIYRSGRMPPLLPELSSARDEEVPDFFIEGEVSE